MPAHRADIFSGGCLFLDIGRGVSGRFPFDHAVIIGIRHGRIVAEDVRSDHFSEKDGVRGGVHRVDHPAGNIRAAVGDDGQRVFHCPRDSGKFIEILPRAEPERADDGGVGIFCEHGDREVPAVADALVRIILLVDAHHHGGGGRGDLCRAVGGAARRPAVIPRGNDIHAVREGMECLCVHGRTSFFAFFVAAALNNFQLSAGNMLSSQRACMRFALP